VSPIVPTPVLLIAYRRSENTLNIISRCIEYGATNIYVVIDGSKGIDPTESRDITATRVAVESAQKKFPGRITLHVRTQNVGCAASVLSACDWFFTHEEFGIILEDDCIPSSGFFTLVSSAKTIINQIPDVWLVCGTQFAPKELMRKPWILSSYALIWGWGTSREKWRDIRQALLSEEPTLIKSTSSPTEFDYWKAGSRRAREGFVDVWDTVLLYQMIKRNALAILPKVSQVSNVGNDAAATHTIETTQWLNRMTEDFEVPSMPPERCEKTDKWLRKYFYKISLRHRVSTKITFLRDLLVGHPSSERTLIARWMKAEIIDH